MHFGRLWSSACHTWSLLALHVKDFVREAGSRSCEGGSPCGGRCSLGRVPAPARVERGLAPVSVGVIGSRARVRGARCARHDVPGLPLARASSGCPTRAWTGSTRRCGPAQRGFRSAASATGARWSERDESGGPVPGCPPWRMGRSLAKPRPRVGRAAGAIEKVPPVYRWAWRRAGPSSASSRSFSLD